MIKPILKQCPEEKAVIHVEPKEHVKTLLSKLKELSVEKSRLKSEIPEDLLDSIQYCEDKIESIQAEIKDLVSFEVQDSIKTEYGQAVYRKGSPRVSYDRKILDAIMDDKVREAINPARKETQVKGSVTIETF